jgi:hypothetical protein
MRRTLILTSLAMLAGCVHGGTPADDTDGPGMIVTFSSVIDGRSISVKNARLPSGKDFGNPGAITGRRSSNWRFGKTSGGSGDGRGLPEWVEFEWSEPVYPEDPKQTLEEYRALPRKTQRVQVRERVPLEAVQEAIESRRNAPRGKMPSKMLWLYFVWTDQGVKFHWSLDESGRLQPLREGGDDIDAM